MGGIGPGILYRASHPIGDGEEDAAITKLARRARIAAILNFADTSREIMRKAYPVSWYRKILDSGGVIALGMNFDGMSRRFCVQLKKGIQFMLNRPGPYLIHCYAGIDRTGFVAIVLEALMGASLHEIIDDYLKSFLDDKFIAPHDSQQYQRDSAEVHEILATINNGKPVMEEKLRETAEQYLMSKVFLTIAELELLKERLAGKT
jgi:hypothetical protein